MKYPKMPEIGRTVNLLQEYARLKFEYGTDREVIGKLLEQAEEGIREALDKLKQLPENSELTLREPDSLEKIHKLRPDGPRQLWKGFNRDKYLEKLQGALLGRFAGCTLGAPVEFWSVEAMKDWAAYIGDAFPPENYWSSIKNPNDKRYEVSECFRYTRNKMDGVPVDDDITYTILGLLMMEDYGPDFSIEDVGKGWVRYLPYACTAEAVALDNLRAGVPAGEAAMKDNPYVQWIGADIRSDPWGYLAPGLPEKAAEFAYRDAYISHRRNGIYGEMFFSAVIAAAFEKEDTIGALRTGLTEIPADCLLAGDVRWALEAGKDIRNYADARKAVEERFEGMSGVHTNLNACLTIFGLMIGGEDFSRVIGETVAMGYDNDCTAATAGSIIGAVKGLKGIPPQWYKRFNNRVLTYIIGCPELKIDQVVTRFANQAERVWKTV